MEDTEMVELTANFTSDQVRSALLHHYGLPAATHIVFQMTTKGDSTESWEVFAGAKATYKKPLDEAF